MTVLHSAPFLGFRHYVVRQSRGNTRREEAEYLYNEAHGLLASVKKLQHDRKRGRGQAGGWQAVHEAALRLLVRAKIQPAVVGLFSVLLRGVLEKSRDLDKRCAAQWAAAEAEAKGVSLSLRWHNPLCAAAVGLEFDQPASGGAPT